MNIKSGLVLLIAIVAGVLGGTAAYQVAAPTSSSAEPAARDSIVIKKGDRARENGRGLAPCKRPATLEGGRCVTDVVKTVVVPAPAAQSSGSSGRASAAPVPVPFDASGDDHEGRHHGGEGEAGHHGDDDGDDDHGDDTDDADDDSHGHHGGDDDGDDDGGTHTRTRTHD
jgi:hypothetical protein